MANFVTGIQKTENAAADAKRLSPANAPPISFRHVLDIQFTKHANTRLSDRNISLTDGQMERVNEGIAKANEKGIRDSLVLVDDVALVVNVRSRTVITALKQETENIFSNIDGAVIV